MKYFSVPVKKRSTKEYLATKIREWLASFTRKIKIIADNDWMSTFFTRFISSLLNFLARNSSYRLVICAERSQIMMRIKRKK
jgi:hypothetical protein